MGKNVDGLNPCFTGICSLSYISINKFNKKELSLNPCFTGICSLSLQERINTLLAE